MDLFLKNEDVNFVKLKLANINGRFLKSFYSEPDFLEPIVEIWNETTQKERALFLNNTGSALRSKIRYEISLLKLTDPSANEEELELPLDHSIGVLKDLSSLLRLPNMAHLSHLKDSVRALINLVKEPRVTIQSFLSLFHSPFVRTKMGSSLLRGEKYVLSNDLYNSFEEELSIMVDKKASEVRANFPGQPYLNISKLFFVHLIVLEDKVLENLYHLRRASSSHEFVDSDSPKDFLKKQESKDEEFLEIRVTPMKSKVQSVVRVAKEHQRYFRLRTSLRPISSASLIDSPEDMSIFGINYSIGMCSKKKLLDSVSLIYCNFMDLNQLLPRHSLEQLKEDFKERMNMKKNQQNSGTMSPNFHPHSIRKDSTKSGGYQGSTKFGQPNSASKVQGKPNQIPLPYSMNQGARKGYNNAPKQTNHYNSVVPGSGDKRKQSAFYKNTAGPTDLKRDRFVSTHETHSTPMTDLFGQPEEQLEFRREQLDLGKASAGQQQTGDFPKKKILKATSSSFYHPFDAPADPSQTAKQQLAATRTSDALESNLSINLEELELSTLEKQGSSGWTQNRKGDSNLFIGDNTDDNKGIAFEKYDYSEKDSILNLIQMPERRVFVTDAEEDCSKRSLNSSGISKELSPCILNSSRTNTSASYARMEGGQFGNNYLEPPLSNSYCDPKLTSGSYNKQEGGRAPILDSESLNYEDESSPDPHHLHRLNRFVSLDAATPNNQLEKDVLYTISEVDDHNQKSQKRKTQKKEKPKPEPVQEQVEDPADFPKLCDVLPPSKELSTVEKIRLYEESMNACKPPPSAQPQPISPASTRKPHNKRRPRNPQGGPKKNNKF